MAVAVVSKSGNTLLTLVFDYAPAVAQFTADCLWSSLLSDGGYLLAIAVNTRGS